MQYRVPRSLVFYACAMLALVVMGVIPAMTSQAATYNIPNGDVAALINAINQANATSGKDEINLTPGGTYTFNAVDNEHMEIHNNNPVYFGPNALPQINSNIIINANGATLQRDPLFSSCNASNELRLFWVNGTGKLTLNNAVVKNGCVGDYGSGGAIYARKGGTVTIVGSTFENNNTTGIVLDGGAITVDEGFLFVENSNFTNNKSTYLGGAISLDSSTGVIYNSNFTSNSNTSSGSAIGADWNSDVTISNSTFIANTGSHSGAVIAQNSSRLRITASSFLNNQANGDGGAVSNDGGTAIITHSEFIGNMASTAGAINNDNMSGGKMYIFNTTFSENVAQGYGGGAINNGGEQLYIFNSTFTNNASPDTDFGGGAIYHHMGAATLVSVTITDNTTLADGGGIYSSGDFLNITRSNISNNSATVGGGLETYTTVTAIHSSNLNNNIADNGSAMYSGYGGAISNSNVMTIVNSTLSGNSASGYESFSGEFKHPGGGAIYTTTDNVAPKPTLTLINTTISGNTSGTLGGAIFVDEYGDLELRNTTITGNSAKYSGGGIGRTIDDIFPENAEDIGITRSIIVGNTVNGALQDCDNQDYISAGNNVLGSSCPTKPGDTVSNNAPAVLNTTLANNGGTTFTHALVTGSPAIDKGGSGCASVDQRGYTRVGACDAGAFELNGAPTAAPSVIITQTGGSTAVNENGLNDSYSLALASAPTGLVTVSIFTDGEVNVSPSTVIFTPQNWSAPQNVTVSGVVDYLIEPAHVGLIGHAVTSADPMYNAAPADTLQVTVAADSGNGGGTETPPPPPAGNILTNAGFETPGGSNSEAGEWKLKNATKDKRKCNKPEKNKVFAHSGNCAFLFKGGPGENSKIVQTINAGLNAGSSVTASVWAQGKKARSGAVLTVKIIYTDGTRNKVNVNVDTGTYSYKQFATPTSLGKPANKVKVMFKNKMGGGKLFIDDLAVVYNPAHGLNEGLDGEVLGLPVSGPVSDLPTPEPGFSTHQ